MAKTLCRLITSFLEFAAQKKVARFVCFDYLYTHSDQPKVSDMVNWWDDKTYGEHLRYVFQACQYTAIINFGKELTHNRKELTQMPRKSIIEKFTSIFKRSVFEELSALFKRKTNCFDHIIATL